MQQQSAYVTAQTGYTPNVEDVLRAAVEDDPERASLYGAILAALAESDSSMGRREGRAMVGEHLPSDYIGDPSPTIRRVIDALHGAADAETARLRAHDSSFDQHRWFALRDIAQDMREAFLAPIEPTWPDGEPEHTPVGIGAALLPALRAALTDQRRMFHMMSLDPVEADKSGNDPRSRFVCDAVLAQLVGTDDRTVSMPLGLETSWFPHVTLCETLGHGMFDARHDAGQRAEALKAHTAYVALVDQLDALGVSTD
jgi:hypothetical protein